MAAYHQVDDVTCGLTACTPGSTPGPTLDNEYGKPLTFIGLLYPVHLLYTILPGLNLTVIYMSHMWHSERAS